MHERRQMMRSLWNTDAMLCTVDSVYVLDTVYVVLGCDGCTPLSKKTPDHAHVDLVAVVASLFSHTVGHCWRTSEVMLPLIE